MKNKQPLIFPISFNYFGKEIQTKGMKCTYVGNEILYKIALPSVLSTVSLFWIIREENSWKPGFETAMEPGLQRLLIDAISSYDEAKPIYPKYKEFELKSA